MIGGGGICQGSVVRGISKINPGTYTIGGSNVRQEIVAGIIKYNPDASSIGSR